MRNILLFASVALSFANTAAADWKNESEVGILLNHGNTRSQTMNARQESGYTVDANTFSFKGTALRQKSKGDLSAKQWSLMLKYERALSDNFSLVASQSVESDKFAGIRQRYNTDIGPKYFFFKEDKVKHFFVEGGYRFTRENKTDYTRKSFQKARLYSEWMNTWTESTSTKLWAEYVPNFTDSKDWLFNAEASTTTNMSKILALKLSYLMKYDNQPNPGALKKTDGAFATSLIAKF